MKSIRLVTPLSLALAAAGFGVASFVIACGSDDDDSSTPDAAVYVDGGTMPGLPSGPTGVLGGEGGIDTTMYDATTGDDTTGGGGNDSGLYNFDSGTPADGGADAGDAGDASTDGGVDAGDAGDASVDAGADAGDAGDAGGSAIGTVVVLRLGDTTNAVSGTATVVNSAYLDHVTTAGVISSWVDLSSSTFGLENANTSGGLQLSTDGHSLAVGGFGAATGATVTTATPQSIASITAAGTVRLTTIASSNASYATSGAAIRDVATNDGTAFWVTGTAGTTGAGVWYFPFNVTTPQAGVQVTTAPATTRGVGIFGGQLFASGEPTGAGGVYSVGAGVPVTTAQTSTNTLTQTSPYGFVGFDTDTTVGIDLAYVADSSAGVVPFTLSGGTWTAGTAIKLGTAGAFSVTGVVTGTTVQLFATTYGATASSLYTLTGSRTAPTATLVVAAPTGEQFRGVSLAPSN